MKALVLRAADGIESARIEELSLPEPEAGEVRVRIVAASLNHRELWIACGQYPGMALPTVLGADGAGIIDAVGEGVDASEIGRRVVLYPGAGWGADERIPSNSFGLLGMPGPGTLAEAICVPFDNVFPCPAHLTFAEAAALPVAGLTAYRALTVKAAVKQGDKVLITGIGGGVAMFSLLFALAMGARVFVTSSSQEKIEAAIELGAEAGFDYREEDWGKALAKASGGVDVVIDGAPNSSVRGYARALAMGCRIVIYGSTGSPKLTLNAPDLFLRHATIFGTAMGSPRDFAAMLAFVEAHNLKPVIDRMFAFEDSLEALLYLQNSHGFGKVVIASDDAATSSVSS